jgi:hypothetical protein
MGDKASIEGWVGSISHLKKASSRFEGAEVCVQL